MTARSSAEWRRARSPSENLFCGHDSTMSVHHHTDICLMRPYAICKGWLHIGPGQCGTDSAMTMSSDEGWNLRAEWWGDCYAQEMTATKLSTWKWRHLESYRIHIGFLDGRRAGGWLKKSWWTGHSGCILQSATACHRQLLPDTGWRYGGKNRKPWQLCRT